MGRKPTITAVPVEPKQEGLVDDEVKTDAEQMTEIINEVNVEPDEPVLVQEYTPAPKAKARPKRAPKKQEVIVPEVEVTSSFDEVEAVVTVPDELKVETKVTCPDCGKQMSAKTLRYSHGPNCQTKKQKQSEENDEFVKLAQVAKQVAREVGGEDGANALHTIGMLEALNRIPDHVINHMIQTRTRASRAVRRQEMVEKIMQNAF